jgi:hypothetical protein
LLRRTGNSGDKQVALGEQVHISIFCGTTLRSAYQAASPSKWLVRTSCPRDCRRFRIFIAASIAERLPATVKPN